MCGLGGLQAGEGLEVGDGLGEGVGERLEEGVGEGVGEQFATGVAPLVPPGAASERVSAQPMKAKVARYRTRAHATRPSPSEIRGGRPYARCRGVPIAIGGPVSFIVPTADRAEESAIKRIVVAT